MLGDTVRWMDLFGSGFDFKMNMRDRIYSWKGGILSIILIICSLIYTIVCCFNLINNFYSSNSVKLLIVTLPQVQLSSNDNFMFAYCLGPNLNSSQAHDQVFDNSINYTLAWRTVSKLPNIINGEVSLKFKRCTFDKFNRSVVNRWNFKYFEGCMCVTPEDLKYNISYFMTDSYYTFYDFEVKFNDTILNNKTMYNQIVNYFNNNTPVGNFYYVDTSADIDKYTKPFTYFMNFHSQMLNPSSQVTSNLYLTNIKMEINDNIFTEDIISYRGVSIDKESINIKTGITYDLLSNYNGLHSVRLYASNKSLLLTRTNLKFDAFIGNLFSFLCPFFIILQLINNKINSQEAKQNLVQVLCKNYRINNKIIKKIKLIRETYNEIEFEEKKDPKDLLIGTNRLTNTETSEKSNKEIYSKIRKSFRQIRSEIRNPKDIRNDGGMKFTLRKVDNDFNNDPLALEANRKAEERIYLEGVFNHIDEVDFKYDWFNYLYLRCRKNKEKFLIRQKYFECAESLVDYYFDVSTYFKKMVEVDIFKYLNYNSQQRKFLTYCSDINFSFKGQDIRKEKLYDIYNRSPLIDIKFDSQLTTMILNAKQDETSEKIIELIQNNNIIFYD